MRRGRLLQPVFALAGEVRVRRLLYLRGGASAENLRESHSGVPASRGFPGGRLSPLTIATSVKLKALQFY